MDRDTPRFDIIQRPTRRYPPDGGVEHDGGTVFVLTPQQQLEESIPDCVANVLKDGPYRYGDWFELPMPLFLVHDDSTSDTFRVAIRDATIEIHVLPETEQAGLIAFYERLVRISNCSWSVETRTENPQST